jgi:hypothetical protein
MDVYRVVYEMIREEVLKSAPRAPRGKEIA